MKKIYPLLVLLFLTLLGVNTNAQRIILFQENFNGATNQFSLNNGGAATGCTNTGANNWIVNNQYNGNGIYHNTPDQSNTSGGGGITGAPTSQYLHIHDSNAAGASNANYDTSAASDNFTQMGGDICTLAYDTIDLVFYYIAEGNAADYGQLYYSIDGGGSWVLLAPPSPLNNTSLWQYVIVSNPIFAHQATLRFGWRWTNTGQSPPKDVSIGLDDIFIVGSQNPLIKPTLTVSNVSPSTICLGTDGEITLTLSKPLCDGSYVIELSNGNGNFNGGLSFPAFIASGQTTVTVPMFFPYSLAEGGCYKIKVSRSDPPFISSNTTACFSLKNCGDSIKTLEPVVLFGPDTACTKSVIDVPFYSYGKYHKGNNFIAQLSDANGSFASPNKIGSSPDSTTWDPAVNPAAPGSVSGLIPDVPPGCGYYIRVVSTAPIVDPPSYDYYGPFCLRRCDVLSDSTHDIHVCITPTTGQDANFLLTINQWNNNSQYAPGDSFLIQIIDSKTYAILNTGSFGVVVTNKSGQLTLSVPDLPQVIALLGSPGTGMYYVRLISMHSSTPWNNYGTLVRLTIGSITPPGTIEVFGDTVICSAAGGTDYFFVNPPNTNSSYLWQVDPRLGFPPGQPGPAFPAPYPPPYEFGISFPQGFPGGYYWFSEREVNNGCFSPWADSVHVRLIPTPNVAIAGPNPVCQKDTATFSVKFTDDTYYQWSTSNGRAIDTSNNIFRLLFDSTGKATLSIIAINQCGQSKTSRTFIINPKPEIFAGNDTTVCAGQPVVLNVSGTVKGGTITYQWNDASAVVSSNTTYSFTPEDNQTYVVLGTSNLGCKDKDTVSVFVFPLPDVDVVKKNITCYGDANGSLTAIAISGTPPYNFVWSTTPEQNTASISGLFPGKYNVTVTDTHGCSADTAASLSQPQPMALKMNSTQISYGSSDGTAAVVVYGGTPPFTFDWSTTPTQNGQQVSGLAPGTYSVTVTDAAGCTQMAYVTLVVKKNALYVPNAFSPNGDGVNDEFNYFGINLKQIYMAIYNRWGEKVFETSDMDVNWDGTYKGLPESVGAYAYYIEATFEDGSTELKKGNVTIIR